MANNYNPIDGWTGGGSAGSSNGTTWTIPTPGYLQYSLNATAAPEPRLLGLALPRYWADWCSACDVGMKRSVLNGLVAVVVGLLGAQIWNQRGQGTITYVSNLGQPSSGSVAAGSDSWFGADFFTGQNSGGYLLNSIQLAMSDPSGSPGGFTVLIYTGIDAHGGTFPGTSMATLSGSGNPATAGMYTYAPVSSLTLLPNMEYFIVVNAGTTAANGAYQWDATGTPIGGFNGYHWGNEIFFAQSRGDRVELGLRIRSVWTVFFGRHSGAGAGHVGLARVGRLVLWLATPE